MTGEFRTKLVRKVSKAKRVPAPAVAGTCHRFSRLGCINFRVFDPQHVPEILSGDAAWKAATCCHTQRDAL